MRELSSESKGNARSLSDIDSVDIICSKNDTKPVSVMTKSIVNTS